MTTRDDRRLAILIQAAPVAAGIPLWILITLMSRSSVWGVYFMFSPGYFMLAAGLLAPLIALPFAGALARMNARNALRFHGILAVVPIALAIAIGIATRFDRPNQPPLATVMLFVCANVGLFVLPIIELVRAISRALTASRA